MHAFESANCTSRAERVFFIAYYVIHNTASRLLQSAAADVTHWLDLPLLGDLPLLMAYLGWI
jgi:hypothetical protein